jgi:molybdopterin-guanine dinucleotide biosynthesis protein A
MRLSAYVLAGGGSTRFGSDKARAVIDGAPLLVHAAESLAAVARDVTVVAAVSEAYADLGFRTIADRRAGFGPMGGLEAAMADACARAHAHAWALVTACDWLGFRPEWIQRLVEVLPAETEPHDPPRVIAFRGERWEPLPALYHTSALPLVRARMAEKKLALWHLIESLPARAVALPADWTAARQMNRPDA